MRIPETLYHLYKTILQECGFNICGIIEKYFEPHGYTALFLLSESHFAIHTFPEENKVYIELSSCIDKPFEKFIRVCANTESK